MLDDPGHRDEDVEAVVDEDVDAELEADGGLLVPLAAEAEVIARDAGPLEEAVPGEPEARSLLDAGPADPIPEEDEPAITSRKPGTPGDTAGDDGSPSAAASPGGSGTPAGNACIAQPSCGGAGGPSLGAKRAWTHTLQTPLIVASGPAFHRGRDQIYSVGEPQWVLGKLTYGYADVDLTGEDVDVFVERGCAGAWEKLGTTKTTTGGRWIPVAFRPISDGTDRASSPAPCGPSPLRAARARSARARSDPGART